MNKDIRFIFLLSLQIVVIGLLVFITTNSLGQQKRESQNILGSINKETAGKLHAAGLINEAIEHYEKYLNEKDIDLKTRSKISFSLGELYESEGNYKKALGWFYKVDFSDENSKYKEEANKKIVSLLERLKKYNAAKRALRVNTTLKGDSIKGANIVAKIGNKNIYDFQINESMDQLPNYVKKSFEGKQGKMKYLQKYIADELIYQKAQRLGLETDTSFLKKFESLKKQMLIEKIIQDEIKEKAFNKDVDESDLKNYFQANSDKFKEKAHIKAVILNSKSKKDLMKAKKGFKKEKDLKKLVKKYSKDPFKEETIFLDGSNKIIPTEALTKIFKQKENSFYGPILKEGIYHLIFIKSKKAEVKYPFSKIKESVAQSYKMEKGQDLYQKLITETIKNEKVEIFAERLK